MPTLSKGTCEMEFQKASTVWPVTPRLLPARNEWWDALVPRAYVGGMINLQGRTSSVHAGALWLFPITDRIFAEGGAMEAAIAAKQAGKIRYIGFTGHKDPAIHLRMLQVAEKHNFHFDTVQMPVNVMDAHFRSFTKEVLPVAIKQGIGVLAMKTFGDNYVLQSKAVEAVEALHYSMNLPVSVIITGIDSRPVLDQALNAVRTFRPLTETQVASLLERTRIAAATGRFEPFKTSSHFDGTAQNPKWLG